MNADQQSNKEICELFITDVLKMECGFNSGNYTKIECFILEESDKSIRR